MIKFFAALLATFTVLCFLWCTAASAAVYEETGCSRRPMVQGTVGEQVTTCELRHVPSTVARTTVRPMARLARRAGTTTVMHYGHRAPTYTITYIAAR